MASWLGQLRRNPEFSDVTLECQGRSFRVHRNVLASQSPVLRAMCSGPYKEQETRLITVEVTDAETLDKMLDGLYSGSYDDGSLDQAGAGGPAPAQPRRSSMASASTRATAATAAAKAAVERKAAAPQTPASPTRSNPSVQPSKDQLDAVIANIYVYAAADYYQMASLIELSTTKFERALQSWLAAEWSCSGFLRIAQEICNLVPTERSSALLAELEPILEAKAGDLMRDVHTTAALAALRTDFLRSALQTLMRAYEQSSAGVERLKGDVARLMKDKSALMREKNALKKQLSA